MFAVFTRLRTAGAAPTAQAISRRTRKYKGASVASRSDFQNGAVIKARRPNNAEDKTLPVFDDRRFTI